MGEGRESYGAWAEDRDGGREAQPGWEGEARAGRGGDVVEGGVESGGYRGGGDGRRENEKVSRMFMGGTFSCRGSEVFFPSLKKRPSN